MNYRVVVTSKAKQQLAQAAIWWAQHRSLEQAARWLDGFEQAITGLAENPERHALARENDFFELPFRVRQLQYGLGSQPTHRAVFEIRGDTVFVVAVRHLAQQDLTRDDL